jgi:hypothetical protein
LKTAKLPPFSGEKNCWPFSFATAQAFFSSSERLETPLTLGNLLTVFYYTVIEGTYGNYTAISLALPDFMKYCRWVVATLRKEAGDWSPSLTEAELKIIRFATGAITPQLFSVEIQEPTNPAQISDQTIVSRISGNPLVLVISGLQKTGTLWLLFTAVNFLYSYAKKIQGTVFCLDFIFMNISMERR